MLRAKKIFTGLALSVTLTLVGAVSACLLLDLGIELLGVGDGAASAVPISIGNLAIQTSDGQQVGNNFVLNNSDSGASQPRWCFWAAGAAALAGVVLGCLAGLPRIWSALKPSAVPPPIALVEEEPDALPDQTDEIPVDNNQTADTTAVSPSAPAAPVVPVPLPLPAAPPPTVSAPAMVAASAAVLADTPPVPVVAKPEPVSAPAPLPLPTPAPVPLPVAEIPAPSVPDAVAVVAAADREPVPAPPLTDVGTLTLAMLARQPVDRDDFLIENTTETLEPDNMNIPQSSVELMITQRANPAQLRQKNSTANPFARTIDPHLRLLLKKAMMQLIDNHDTALEQFVLDGKLNIDSYKEYIELFAHRLREAMGMREGVSYLFEACGFDVKNEDINLYPEWRWQKKDEPETTSAAI
ncbi:MAG: hypothetical protein LBK71_12675 [Verrucomicrobiales bacterium]|jgi:hypothetical protein|nr:hypothetical protein [Verrucomicrobiales bacterium]